MCLKALPDIQFRKTQQSNFPLYIHPSCKSSQRQITYLLQINGQWQSDHSNYSIVFFITASSKILYACRWPLPGALIYCFCYYVTVVTLFTTIETSGWLIVKWRFSVGDFDFGELDYIGF
jgi:hypothetical protein